MYSYLLVKTFINRNEDYKMKLLYVNNVMEDISPGYKEKIYSQCIAFEELGFETYLYTSSTGGIIIYKIKDGIFNQIYKRNYKYNYYVKSDRIKNRLTLKRYREFISGMYYAEDLIKPDVTYIRRIYPLLSNFITFIKSVKKLNKIIVYEYPTFPWEKEMIKGKSYIFYILDKIYYKRLISSVDIVTAILGNNIKLPQKFIEITNGIDVDKNKAKALTLYKDRINLIGVANLQYWHGFDRIIEGLRDYYTKNNNIVQVNFHIVGVGHELNNLKNMVNNYGLDKYVIFHGQKAGNELNKLFDECQIGIGSLGLYKMNMKVASTLKAREYCSRGIPFIIGYDEKGFDDNFEYILKVSNNDNPINIEKVIEFYEKTYKNPEVINNIRHYAKENFNWKKIMNPVAENIKTIYKINNR